MIAKRVSEIKPSATLAIDTKAKQLQKEGKDIGCKPTFTLLSDDESSSIMKTLDDISSLLPKEIDRETRCRLLTGYLRSEDLLYDAWQLLEHNGIAQEQTKKDDR